LRFFGPQEISVDNPAYNGLKVDLFCALLRASSVPMAAISMGQNSVVASAIQILFVSPSNSGL